MEQSHEACPICDVPLREVFPRLGDIVEMVCPNGGRFRISGAWIETFKLMSPEKRQQRLATAQLAAGEGIPMLWA